MTTAKAIPGSLLVFGGGVVGVEMATAYASLGAKVTIVEALPRLIAGEEEFASEQVKDALEDAGAEVVLGTKATAVQREEGNGPVTLEFEDGRAFTGEELLVAIGRVPHTDGLGLETLGLEPRQVGRGGRAAARARPRVAVRRGRRKWPRAAHPHGQVPGAPRRRPYPRTDRPDHRSCAPTGGSPPA